MAKDIVHYIGSDVLLDLLNTLIMAAAENNQQPKPFRQFATLALDLLPCVNTDRVRAPALHRSCLVL